MKLIDIVFRMGVPQPMIEARSVLIRAAWYLDIIQQRGGDIGGPVKDVVEASRAYEVEAEKFRRSRWARIWGDRWLFGQRPRPRAPE